jgi:hypothetical protein
MTSTTTPQLPTLSALPIGDIVMLGFLLVGGLFCIFSAILYFHWNAYSTDSGITRLTLLLYFGTTIPLLLIMGLMTLVI